MVVVPSFLGEISTRALLQPLVSKIAGLVLFGENLSYVLSPGVSKDYFLQSISLKLIYQFLCPNNGYLFFRCFEKVFEEEKNENRKENSRGVSDYS